MAPRALLAAALVLIAEPPACTRHAPPARHLSRQSPKPTPTSCSKRSPPDSAPVDLAPKYDVARVKLAQSALVPSRVFNDTTVWDARPYAVVATAATSRAARRARATASKRAPSLTPASRAGDTRHSIALEQLAGSASIAGTRTSISRSAISAEEVSFSCRRCSARRKDAPSASCARTIAPRFRARRRRSAAASRSTRCASRPVRPARRASRSPRASIRSSCARRIRRSRSTSTSISVPRSTTSRSPTAPVRRCSTSSGRDRAMTVRYRLEQGKLTTLYGPPSALARHARCSRPTSRSR